jgi:hypothetical protein
VTVRPLRQMLIVIVVSKIDFSSYTCI